MKIVITLSAVFSALAGLALNAPALAADDALFGPHASGNAPEKPAKPVYGPADPDKRDDIVITPLTAPPGVPIALVKAAETAAENYPSIRSAEAQVRAARADLKSARWLRFPSLQVETDAVSQGTPGVAGGGLTLSLVAEQPVFDFGRIGGQIDKAKASLLANRAGIDETAREIAMQVTDAYYGLASAARHQEILQKGVEQHKMLLQTIQNRVRQEVSPQADLDLAMSRTAQIEQDLEFAKAQRAASLSQLIQYVGAEANNLGDVPEYDEASLHPTEDGAMDRALSCDPTLARLRAEVKAAQADAKVAKASIFPQILGQVTQNDITGTRAGVVLRAQSSGGLSQIAATEAAGARVQAAELTISTAERELREQLELDFVNNRSSRERVAAGAQASMTSQLVTESYKRQFITGRRTWLDVMNAVREATNNEISTADAEIGAMQSNAHIWLRTCGWQPRPLDNGTVERKK